jgi:fermentation-respiration switch protein FrsA (DUF1100 family)
LLGLGGFFVAALAGVGYYGCMHGIRRPKPKPKAGPGKPENPQTRRRNAERAEGTRLLHSLEPEDVSLRSKRDGLLLRGWYVPAPVESRKLVIFAHGYHCDGPTELADQLAFYRGLGYHCLYPDHRAHGRSEGKYIGFGALEAPDLLDWARAYIERLGEDIEITLHGISMGGATVTLCNSLNPPPQMKRIIADCPYTNALEQMRHTLKLQMNIRFEPLLRAADLWCRLLAGYSLKKDADPLGKIPSARLPMLFIHGEEDGFVQFSMGKRLYEACPTEKDFFWVPGAAHAIAHHTDMPGYEAKVRAFLGEEKKVTVGR